MIELEQSIRNNWATKELQGTRLTLLVRAMHHLINIDMESGLLNDIQMYIIDVQLSTLEGTDELVRVTNELNN